MPYYTEKSDGVVNGDVKKFNDNLKQVYSIVIEHPGIKISQVAALLSKPQKTVEKQLSNLRKKGIIEYRGSARTGGYFAK